MSPNEAVVKRNPRGDFKVVQSSRPAWDETRGVQHHQTAAPGWSFGDGPNDRTGHDRAHVSIDPYAEGRPAGFNYKLLISAVVPRPIALVSTRSPEGRLNLAPFSYFQLIAHDPPLFVIGFATPLARDGNIRDTLRNLVDTRECVINIVSEAFVEAANATSTDAPAGASEWAVSGLTPVSDCETVGCPRVREAIFSIEGKLESVREIDSRAKPGSKSATMVTIEGTRFWAREDAINEDKNVIDPEVCERIAERDIHSKKKPTNPPPPPPTKRFWFHHFLGPVKLVD